MLFRSLKAVVAAARASEVTVFVVPHHRYAPGDLDTWAHPNPYIQASARGLVFEKGGWGGEWHPDFAPQPGDTIVHKERASAFYGTPMIAKLNHLGVRSLIMCGESTSGCVRNSVQDAYMNGYHVALVEECCFDRNMMAHKTNLFDMHHKYADVMHVDEVVDHLYGMRKNTPMAKAG